MNNIKFSNDDPLNLLIIDALAAIKSFPEGTVITSKDLFDADFYDNNPPGVNIELGHIVSDLVKQGVLPITRISNSGENRSRYLV